MQFSDINIVYRINLTKPNIYKYPQRSKKKKKKQDMDEGYVFIDWQILLKSDCDRISNNHRIKMKLEVLRNSTDEIHFTPKCRSLLILDFFVFKTLIGEQYLYQIN